MAYRFNSDLTAERLRELLDYDPETGIFAWKVMVSMRRPVGSAAGSVTRWGYISIKADRVRYQAHRLVWLYTHGRWPVEEIDHINGDRSDNRLANLREASRTLNARNCRNPRGYSITKAGTFSAFMNVNRRTLYLGTFKTADEARAAYLAGRMLHFGPNGSEALSVS